MEIDPAALSRTNTNPRPSETSSIAVKPIPGAGAAASKTAKTAPLIPRVDYEPFYAEIKAAIGDHWGAYKDAISQFVIGYLNYAELSTVIGPFILTNPNHEHLHNQLICAIFANLSRDIPDSTVASWVSANDKPTNVPKPAAGDAAEQRLKSEIKLLPPRIRHRIKGIRDDPHRPLTHSLALTRSTLTLPHHPSNVSNTASSTEQVSSSSGGLNRDLEIRRRYNLSLISETHDVPTQSNLADRILPICYEEGLSSGLGNTAESASELLDTALGIFLKDTLTTLIGLTRVDAPVSGPRADSVTGVPGAAPPAGLDSSIDNPSNYVAALDRSSMGISTAKYKRMLAAEEAAWSRGEVKRGEAGLLPVEVASVSEAGSRKGVNADLRVAWETGDTMLRGMMPWLGEKLGVGWGDDEVDGVGEDEIERDESGRRRQGGLRLAGTTSGGGTNGNRPVLNGLSNGINGHMEEEAVMDEQDWGWQGARPQDRSALNDLLDECLNHI